MGVSENGVYPETAMFIRTWTNGFWGTVFSASIRSVIISQILLQIRRYPKILLSCHMFAMKFAFLIGIVCSPLSDTPELEVVAWLCVFHYISYSRECSILQLVMLMNKSPCSMVKHLQPPTCFKNLTQCISQEPNKENRGSDTSGTFTGCDLVLRGILAGAPCFTYTYIHIYIYVCVMCMYIYICV